MADGVSASLEQIALQKSARYVTWGTLTASATGALPPSGTTGIALNVSGYQLGKLAIELDSCVLGFNVQYKYLGDNAFYRIDQSERTGVNYNWTQQVDISGVEYIYVAVTSFSGTGSYGIKIALGDDSL